MSALLADLGVRPLIMGVVNVTPDSFSDGGRFHNPEKAVGHALAMLDSGADIIDIGGESSRPGSEGVSLDEELKRVLPVIKKLAKENIPISIDTVKSEVARQSLDVGACMVNDISALSVDPEMGKTAAEFGAFLVLMHMRGTPKNMQDDTEYDDIIGEILTYLTEAAERAVGEGVAKEKIIIDPGIGFGKSIEGNFTILKNLHRFLETGYHLLVGTSRKSFIGKTQDLDIADRLEGSIASALYAILNGADIVRVHDVKETKRALKILERIVMA